MHEISIVSSIVKTLEIEFEEEKLKTMTGLYLKVGILSNIEPKLLLNAYEAYTSCGSIFHGVDLKIESSPITIRCDDCDHITSVKNYVFKCEKCEKPSKSILTGEEMLIHKVEFQD